MAAMTLAAVEQDTACPEERPPKTIATRILRPGSGRPDVGSLGGWALIGDDPIPPVALSR